MRNFVCLLAISLLTSCYSASLYEIENAKPQGSAFHEALFREYKDFAQYEADQYDWKDAFLFADKAMMAAYGKDVQPENPTLWKIDPRFKGDMKGYRAELLEALTPAAKQAKPELAAKVLFAYDCWIEQQEEAWQAADIASCRDLFIESLDKLRSGSTAFERAIGFEAPAEAAEIVQEYTPRDINMVFFELGSANLNPNSQRIIDAVVGALKEKDAAGEAYKVQVDGHADRLGSAAYNKTLSARRAQRVANYLVKAGIAKSKIIATGLGEAEMKVPTKDGVAHPKNRRVEIIITYGEEIAQNAAEMPVEPATQGAFEKQEAAPQDGLTFDQILAPLPSQDVGS